MECLSPVTLSSYLDGALEPAPHQQVVAHLLLCPRCGQELAALRQVHTLTVSLPSGHASPQLKYRILNAVARQEAARKRRLLYRIRRCLRPLRVTTAIAFSLAAGIYLGSQRSSQPVREQTALVRRPAESLPVPPRPFVATVASPALVTRPRFAAIPRDPAAIAMPRLTGVRSVLTEVTLIEADPHLSAPQFVPAVAEESMPNEAPMMMVAEMPASMMSNDDGSGILGEATESSEPTAVGAVEPVRA